MAWEEKEEGKKIRKRRKKYVRFLLTCVHTFTCILATITNMCVYSAYWWGEEWGAQKESFYFVVFNGMYIYVWIHTFMCVTPFM